jgi:scramblase
VTDLFSLPLLRVEQPRKVVQTQTQYNIYNDDDGALLAIAADTVPRTRSKAVRAALPGNVLAGPRTLMMRDTADRPVLIIDAQDDRRTTLVREPQGEAEVIGMIRAERTTRHYTLLDGSTSKLGEVTGDLGLRKFAVTDNRRRNSIAQINKKWAGLRAEVFTTADRYNIEFTEQISDLLRTLVVVSAIVVDLTLHESKDVV